jgi:hypothetical protein
MLAGMLVGMDNTAEESGNDFAAMEGPRAGLEPFMRSANGMRALVARCQKRKTAEQSEGTPGG